jgi:hypothetical protein
MCRPGGRVDRLAGQAKQIAIDHILLISSKCGDVSYFGADISQKISCDFKIIKSIYAMIPSHLIAENAPTVRQVSV